MSLAASLRSLLPAPVGSDGRVKEGEGESSASGPSTTVLKKLKEQSTRIPAYGERDDWVPRTQDDFGDGGAYPECHVPQFPLDMGRNAKRTLNGLSAGALVPMMTDAQGRTRYDAVVMQGHGPGAVVHSRPQSLVGRRYTDEEMERPAEEELQDTVERTKRAIQEKLASVVGDTNASRPSASSSASAQPQLVKYTAAASSASHASGASQRLVQIVEKKADPLEPSKFRVQKSATLLETEAPVPVLRDAPKKTTKEEADAWNIPVSFSNWNSHGFTIGLDKREAAGSSAGQEIQISSRFATMASALDTAQQSAREQVAFRARLEQQKQLQQRELEDQQAREVARLARLRRAGIHAEAEATETEEERSARMARDAVRDDMRRDHEEEARRERMGARAKAASAAISTTKSGTERDISERVALGQAVPRAQGEALYDQRLFNQTQGLDHGFVNDEEYNLYDRPLLTMGREEALFRSVNQREGEIFQEEFNADRLKDGFRGGKDKPSRGNGPVEFERDEEEAHQQRMEEIERQKAYASRAQQRSEKEDEEGQEAPSRGRASPPRRGGREDSPPRRGRDAYPSPPRRGGRDSYPSPPRRGGGGPSAGRDSSYPSPPRRGGRDSYPSPPRSRGGAGDDGSPPRSRSDAAPSDDPMDSMLSFMSDAKSSRKRERDDGRGPVLGRMHAVAGSSGSAEDYQDNKRSRVNFVPSSGPHRISEEDRRHDAERERQTGGSRYDSRRDDDDYRRDGPRYDDRRRGDGYDRDDDRPRGRGGPRGRYDDGPSRGSQQDEFGRDRR